MTNSYATHTNRAEDQNRGRRDLESQALLEEISDYCRRHGLAESTFGRLAINDGKLMTRLRTGGRVTHETLARMQDFMRSVETPLRRKPSRLASGQARGTRAPFPVPSRETEANFRLYDNRQKYLLFVTTAARNGWSPSASATSSPTSIRARRRSACSSPASATARSSPA
ncbi:MAG: hypothetical protein WDN08_06395 [Rhizomicrobium sp.]